MDTTPIEPKDIKRTFRQELPCALSDNERLVIGSRLSAKLKERDAVKAKAKQVAGEYGVKVKALDNEIGRMAEAVDSGNELREVQCTEAWLGGSQIRVVRDDTGVTLDIRPASAHERQEPIPGLGDDDGTDGQGDDGDKREPVRQSKSSTGATVAHAGGEPEGDGEDHGGGEDDEDDDDDQDDDGTPPGDVGDDAPVVRTPPGGAPEDDAAAWAEEDAKAPAKVGRARGTKGKGTASKPLTKGTGKPPAKAKASRKR